jgi:hypothetical protein
MKAFLAACLLTGLGLLAGAERASAQFNPGQPYQPYQQPLSPFLNLNRPGNPGVNYFGLVRPQLDTTKQLQTLQYQQQLLAQMGLGVPLPDGTVAPYSNTGHATSFVNYSHYYYQPLGSTGAGTGTVPGGVAPGGLGLGGYGAGTFGVGNFGPGTFGGNLQTRPGVPFVPGIIR